MNRERRARFAAASADLSRALGAEHAAVAALLGALEPAAPGSRGEVEVLAARAVYDAVEVQLARAKAARG